MLPLRFVPFDQLTPDLPNVVVDGSAGPGTVLTLSHWPQSPTPASVLDDLSAQITFRALDHPDWFDGVEVVSNNHFDQDGLVSAFTLLRPDEARSRRDRLIDVASAGDFGTFRDRAAARVAIAVAVLADPDRSPLADDLVDLAGAARVGRLYELVLAMLPDLVDRPEASRGLWAEEDAHLGESLDAIASGAVAVDGVPALDLARIVVPAAWPERPTHRFIRPRRDACHPVALTSSTDCSRLLVQQGDRVSLELRYEGWVMFRSRPIAPRPDLRVLADRLTAREATGGTWHADPPDDLTPRLWADDACSTPPDEVRRAVEDFLATAPTAWSPYPPDVGPEPDATT